MHKEEFLTELRGYLSILDSQEQEDILAEYAQHIDMKMQKGLSEEEAIRDFGPMKELAAEILEAYHVNFDSAAKLPVRRSVWLSSLHRPDSLGRPVFAGKDAGRQTMPQGAECAEDAMPFWRKGFQWIRQKIVSAARGIKRGCRWLARKCRAAAGWIMRPFTGRQQEMTEHTKENMDGMEEAGKKCGRAAAVCRKMGHGIVILWRWFLSFCIFWLKFMWNAGWLLFSLFCACTALFILAGVGATLVFLVQGYPFIGFFMISLGGLLCFGTLSWGAFSMLIRKKKQI